MACVCNNCTPGVNYIIAINGDPLPIVGGKYQWDFGGVCSGDSITETINICNITSSGMTICNIDKTGASDGIFNLTTSQQYPDLKLSQYLPINST